MPTARSRQRPTQYFRFLENGIPIAFAPFVDEFFHESSFPGSNDCVHFKVVPYSGYYGENIATGSKYLLENHSPLGPTAAKPFGPFTGSAQVASLRLDWEKLPSSSQFQILSFLAELDDTIATFSLRFWKKLSYGSINWGLLPLVNDVQEFSKTLANLQANLQLIPYEAQLKVPLRYVEQGSHYQHVAEGEILTRHSGFCSIPEGNDISVLLDRLGFHPDLQTAWDLLPLSFIVDYFLGVGDLLDQFRSRGWVRNVMFRGWITNLLHCRVTTPYDTNLKGSVTPVRSSFETFSRVYCEQLLSSDSIVPHDVPVIGDIPSFRELFNTVYVARQLSKATR